MKIRTTYIINHIEKALAFEWISRYLSRDRFELSFILLNPSLSALESYLLSRGIPVYRVQYRGKRDFFPAFIAIFKLLRKLQTQVIHAHFMEAAMLGFTVGKLLGIKRLVYTRHYSDYHHVYAPQALKYDRLINRLASAIVAITPMVAEILEKREQVSANKIHIIPHGFELSAFMQPNTDLVAALKQKYNPQNRYPVIGMIARYEEWKGIQHVIPAFQSLLNEYPNALLLLANASETSYAPSLRALLNERLSPNNYLELVAFEPNVSDFYQVMDAYIHVPISRTCEAFGQTYVEALAAGIPSIFTLSGIAPTFIKNRENALVVDFQNTEEIYNAMGQILSDNELRKSLIENGQKSVFPYFDIQRFISDLENLYTLKN